MISQYGNAGSEFENFIMEPSVPVSPIDTTNADDKIPGPDGPLTLFKDDYLEDLIQRDPKLMNEYIADVKAFNLKKVSKEILTEDYIQRFDYLMSPGSSFHARKMRIKKLLRDNPCLRSVDPNLLFQRISYFWAEYGPNAEQVDPRHGRPIKRNVRKLEGNE